MLVQLNDTILINTDQIVSVERGVTASNFDFELRIALVGRTGHVVLVGKEAENVWKWLVNSAGNYSWDFES